ncbi:Hypothetical predicted protein [Podarcis lilfordi]|uniref:Uncharacterized protein n=1 Tax=Podarcis lilfordi TaxID=74358 RepID=A0AA35KGB3_9SAUR|nr:Hypothetical predicted protein [Podarcis lilfordi]
MRLNSGKDFNFCKTNRLLAPPSFHSVPSVFTHAGIRPESMTLGCSCGNEEVGKWEGQVYASGADLAKPAKSEALVVGGGGSGGRPMYVAVENQEPVDHAKLKAI